MPESHHIPPKKILLAEDDADDRQFFFDFLKHRADLALISAVENGEEVLTALSAVPKESLPDLIILDQNMPRQNGLQTLQLLKQKPTYQRIPVFIYSTYADEMLKQRSLSAGAVSIFPKPFTPEGYHQMMDAMLAMVE